MTEIPISKVWNRLKLLRFPCFEGDCETKNALPKMKLKEVGKNGWPCSICRLHGTTKCGLSQALGFQWAIFRTKIKGGKVTCQWCGKSSKLTECYYNEGGPIWCPYCGNRTGSYALKETVTKKNVKKT